MPRTNAFLQMDEIHPEYFKEGHKQDKYPPKIQNVISPGKEMLVQVVKEASGQKRPTVTTYPFPRGALYCFHAWTRQWWNIQKNRGRIGA